MYGRPRPPPNPPAQDPNPPTDLSGIYLNAKKKSTFVGNNSKLRELLGLKCFIWCRFDQLEFANRRSDPGLSANPLMQANPALQRPNRTRG